VDAGSVAPWRSWLGHDEWAPFRAGSEDTRVAYGVEARCRDESDEAAEQRERVQVDRHGAVAERLLQRDPHEPIGSDDVLATSTPALAYGLRTIQRGSSAARSSGSAVLHT
jgi:hypothetical protein